MSSSAAVRPIAPGRGRDAGRLLDDRYLLLDVRGSGGFSTVYRARDLRLGSVVAVKLLDAAPDERTRRRFELEAEIGSSLVHPNLVHVTDRGEHDGRLYMVMPLLHGVPLGERRGADYRQVCRWMRQFLSGTRALHEARSFAADEGRTRLLHRDIKPSNCIVSAEGDVTIIDFGLVKPIDRDACDTSSGAILGTPAYMAPECLFGAPASERSDIYSLGVTFFEMLTGERPFVGSIRELQAIHAERPAPPSPRALRPELPAALATLVQAALAPLPADRPASVDVMLRRLDDILRRLRDPVPPPPEPPPPARLAPSPSLSTPSHRKTWLLGALATIVVIVAVIVARCPTPAPTHTRGPDPRRPAVVVPSPSSRPVPPSPTPAVDPPATAPTSIAERPPSRASRLEEAVTAAVHRKSNALRRCPDAPRGLVRFELHITNGRALPRRADAHDPSDRWQECARRILSQIRITAGTGKVRVSVTL